MDNTVLANKEFERISLILNDSVRMEILQENFTAEKIVWSKNKLQSEDVLFVLKYNYYGGTVYNVMEGWLKITLRTNNNLVGEFDMIMHDALASCIMCPETLRKVKGEFNVKIN